jgi:hypothetical protein
MRGKPDISAEQFLRAGQVASGEGSTGAAAAPARITKTIRIDRALDLAVKRTALERQAASGARVTESDLIEAALRHYLKL